MMYEMATCLQIVYTLEWKTDKSYAMANYC